MNPTYKSANETRAQQLDPRDATIARLRGLLETVLDLAVYVNNPSAWDNYDDVMSDRIRLITSPIRRELQSGSELEAE